MAGSALVYQEVEHLEESEALESHLEVEPLDQQLDVVREHEHQQLSLPRS